MIVVERLALVPQSYGVTDVSGAATTTDANGTPSVSAVIWASAVRIPWPASTLPASTSTLPSALMRTIAVDVLWVPPPSFIAQASPRPRPRASGAVQPTARAVCSSPSARSPSIGVSPATYSSPRLSRFLRRSASGSRPSRSAITSICDSPAHVTCGTPYPR